jgi:hypothetical protein
MYIFIVLCGFFFFFFFLKAFRNRQGIQLLMPPLDSCTATLGTGVPLDFRGPKVEL